MPRFDAISRNVNTIDLKMFPTHDGINKLEKFQHPFWRDKTLKEIWKEVSLRKILKNKGGKQHCLVLTLGLRYLWKRGNIRKWLYWNRGLRHLCMLCIEVSRKLPAKPLCFFTVFSSKKSSKSSIFFHSLINEFLWFAELWLKLEEKVPIRTIVNVLCLGRSTLSQNGAKFIQNLTPGFKNHIRNLDNLRQAVESPKSWNWLGYFCPKNRFL